jgi:hypothetical protein
MYCAHVSTLVCVPKSSAVALVCACICCQHSKGRGHSLSLVPAFPSFAATPLPLAVSIHAPSGVRRAVAAEANGCLKDMDFTARGSTVKLERAAVHQCLLTSVQFMMRCMMLDSSGAVCKAVNETSKVDLAASRSRVAGSSPVGRKVRAI